MMQESLDEVLSDEERAELFAMLDSDEDTSHEYNQLQRVDALMRSAPFERAPKRLAQAIMARVAESVQLQARLRANTSLSAENRRVHEELINLTVQLTSLVTTPLMIASSYAIMNHAASPLLFGKVLSQVVASMLVIMHILDVLVTRAEELADEDPEAALAVLALIPVLVLAIVRYVLAEEHAD
jgi:hypothetical protein